jgi:hypothetical protein
MGESVCFTNVVAYHRITHQLIGERKVAPVPNDKVVQLDHLACGAAHPNTSSASMSSMVATTRPTSLRHSARERSGRPSQPIGMMTGRGPAPR